MDIARDILALLGCWQLGTWIGKGIDKLIIWWNNREIVIKRQRDRYMKRMQKWQMKVVEKERKLRGEK